MAKVDTGFCQNCFDVFHYLAGFGFNIVHYQFAVYRVHRNLPRNKQKATRNYSLAIGTYRRRCICSIDNYFHYFFVKKMLSPLTTHHSPLTTHHSPLTTHHSPLTTNGCRNGCNSGCPGDCFCHSCRRPRSAPSAMRRICCNRAAVPGSSLDT